jgi:hypothetical protein
MQRITGAIYPFTAPKNHQMVLEAFRGSERLVAIIAKPQ